VRSFKKRRAEASILLSYVGEAETRKAAEAALRIYKAWQQGRITYRRALAELRKLTDDKG